MRFARDGVSRTLRRTASLHHTDAIGGLLGLRRAERRRGRERRRVLQRARGLLRPPRVDGAPPRALQRPAHRAGPRPR